MTSAWKIEEAERSCDTFLQNIDCISAFSQTNLTWVLQRKGGLTMTSVRNSYIVHSSFPAFASSLHSPQKTFSSPVVIEQPSSASLIWFLFSSSLSLSAQTVLHSLLTLCCISQPGNVQAGFFFSFSPPLSPSAGLSHALPPPPSLLPPLLPSPPRT